MLGSVGSFELLVFLLGGFLLFRLWQRVGETEREQHRLNLRATELERRLAQAEKELEAVRRPARGEATMPVPIATPAVAPKAEQVVATLAKLTAAQRAKLNALVGTGMTSWPVVAEPTDLKGLTRDEKVAVMTYGGDLFSWYAGDVEADTYFCPERHGTYFGSFYLKDAQAVGNPGYSIPTTWTGDMGENLIRTLDAKQAAIIMASFVYHAAMRDEKLPRKPLEGEIAPASTNPAPSAPAP